MKSLRIERKEYQESSELDIFVKVVPDDEDFLNYLEEKFIELIAEYNKEEDLPCENYYVDFRLKDDDEKFDYEEMNRKLEREMAPYAQPNSIYNIKEDD